MSDSSGKDNKAEKPTVKLDGDKGIYTQEEVADLLKEVGVTVKIDAPDGKVKEAKVTK